MEWTPELRDFIQRHIDDDTSDLLLAARKYQGINVPLAVEQIEARRRLKGKLPAWYGNPHLIMGGRVPAEQCSSEMTARFKRSIVEGESLCDMTGGMGVDFWYMSEGMKRAIYTERQQHLCEAAVHNFQMLKDECHPEAEVRYGDGRELPIPSVDVIYLDPARRAGDGSRVYAIEDCEPNVVEWQDELLLHASTVLVKLSPMVDVSDMLRKLKGVTDVYIVGVRNECKEVLVKMQRGTECERLEVVVHCVDFLASGKMEYVFSLSDERTISVDTHLMTSDELVEDFPGRIFEVVEQTPFSSKLLKRLKKELPQANIAARNFPLTADELRKRAGIKDGGEVYLFGVKVKNRGALLLTCRKIVLLAGASSVSM